LRVIGTKQKTTPEAMELWMNSDITGILTDVPGIGPVNAKKLGAKNVPECERITDTFQLLGKYLTLNGPDEVTPDGRNQKFWDYLKSKGINASRAAIVEAIAEKAKSLISGLRGGTKYDFEVWYDALQELKDDSGNVE
jgi:hypothetical protein